MVSEDKWQGNAESAMEAGINSCKSRESKILESGVCVCVYVCCLGDGQQCTQTLYW